MNNHEKRPTPLRAPAILALSLLLAPLCASAAEERAPAEPPPGYTPRGADTCIKCHDEFSDYPVLSIFETPHGEPEDRNSPFGRLQCETCHGAGDAHADMKLKEDEERPPVRTFGPGAPTPVKEQNRVCSSCHQNHERLAWMGSAHQVEGVACASCHTVHAAKDPVLTPEHQPQVCFDCHAEQRADIHKASVHPLRYGQMACHECHNPHGSFAPKLLRGQTLNETCYECHAEKRGPFLWEHAPVAEDCSLCHEPHGSVHPALLKKRPPLLCQQCHSQAGHPSVAYTPAGLPDAAPSSYLLGESCLNCHSRVHGSNHPSGVKLMR